MQLVSATAIGLPIIGQGKPPADPVQAEEDRPIKSSNEHSYTIGRGDMLSAIASEQHTSLAVLLDANLEKLDTIARQEGYRNSDNGNLIFPGTVLTW
jgi:nucleoid-associated protein YgaU